MRVHFPYDVLALTTIQNVQMELSRSSSSPPPPPPPSSQSPLRCHRCRYYNCHFCRFFWVGGRGCAGPIPSLVKTQLHLHSLKTSPVYLNKYDHPQCSHFCIDNCKIHGYSDRQHPGDSRGLMWHIHQDLQRRRTSIRRVTGGLALSTLFDK